MVPTTEDVTNTAKSSDLIIAFMGATGSGKSNLIDTLTGQPGRRAGSRLESYTAEVRADRLSNHSAYGNRLVFVDTPGFDDTTKSDMEILQMLGTWLQKVYRNKIKLAGIVYLHRITDNRRAGTPQRNLHMFGELCGDQAVKKVVLVTTMWDKASSPTSTEEHPGKKQLEYENREKDIFENYWKVVINCGASTARSTNCAESAWKIIDIILKQQDADVLLLPEEIVALKKALSETQAGKALYSKLQKLAEQQEIVRSRAQHARDESNPALASQLETELQGIQKQFDKTLDEMKGLKIPIGKRIVRFFFKFGKKLS